MNQAVPKTVSQFVRAIIEEYQEDAGIVGEEHNIGAIFFICVTKEFDRKQRLHTAIVNLSGAGKTTLAEGILKPFRDKRREDIIDVVRMTGSALERSGSLDGKILLLSQAVGTEPTSIRPLLSEGKLGLMVTERLEGSNKFEATVHNVEGMPVFVTTSTDPDFDPELLRRVIQRTVDESAQQTKAIKKSQAVQASTIHIEKLSKFRKIRAVLDAIELNRPKNIDQVVIPYATLIEEKLSDEIEIRSKYPQLLRLIESIAITKAVCFRGYFLLRQKKSGRQKRIVIANLEDFGDALYLAGASFFHLLPATAQAILDFLSKEIEIVKTSLDQEREEYKKCTVREIQKAVKMERTTINKWSNKLVDKGLVNVEKIKNEKNVEINYFQYAPNTITDPEFELQGFDIWNWLKQEIASKGFSLTGLKPNVPLEFKILEFHSSLWFNPTYLGFARNTDVFATDTHESPIPGIKACEIN